MLLVEENHLSFEKKAPRRGKNGACFFEKCDSQYEAFGGVPGRLELTGKSKKHRGNRKLTSPTSIFISGTEEVFWISRLFPLHKQKWCEIGGPRGDVEPRSAPNQTC